MIKKIYNTTVLLLVSMVSLAQHNPILKKDDPNFLYVADPSAEVFEDKVYVYCSHDPHNARGFIDMQDYVILESSDMKTWTNHGVFLKPREFTWAEGQMNAPDAAYKDGWYYFYFPFNKAYIGVVRSKTPTGPWEQIKKEAITIIFDPTVFVDDDGQAYIYGNDTHIADHGKKGTNTVMGAKLKDNMMELDGPWVEIAKERVAEGVTVFKRDGVYYFMARKGNTTCYFTADNPLPTLDNPNNPKEYVFSDTDGYAKYRGTIHTGHYDAPPHMSVIEFKNKWYFFYHRGKTINDGAYNRRSACFDEMHFNKDGTIQQIEFSYADDLVSTSEFGKGTKHVEAEDYADHKGVIQELSLDQDRSKDATRIEEGDYLVYNDIDFGKNKTNKPIPFFIRHACERGTTDGQIQLILDDLNNEPIKTIDLSPTKNMYDTMTTSLENVSGKHTLYMRFKGKTNTSRISNSILHFNWFEYTPQR